MTIQEKLARGISKHAPVKTVIKVDEHGNEIERYLSVQQAAKENGLKSQAICNAITRGGKTGGMWFQYEKPKEKPREITMPKTDIQVSGFQINHKPYEYPVIRKKYVAK